jgi:hypothetical protein
MYMIALPSQDSPVVISFGSLLNQFIRPETGRDVAIQKREMQKHVCNSVGQDRPVCRRSLLLTKTTPQEGLPKDETNQ